MSNLTDINVNDLSAAALDSDARIYAFDGESYAFDGGQRGWMIHPDLECELTEDEREDETFIPAMNCAYPLPSWHILPYDLKECLDCMTLVKIDDDPYLALTGGGMDQSWEICEAFICLGLLPPVSFAGALPKSAGRGQSPGDLTILDACRKSLSLKISWVQSSLERLEEIA